MRAVRTFAFLAAALVCTAAVAAPFAVQVGDTRLALDTPPGFSDVQSTGSPRLLELAEALTSASNRILLFALEDADVRRFTVGDPPELRRYVLAATPKGLESARVTLAAFHALVADSLSELGTAPPAGTDLRRYLETQASERPRLLGELQRDQEVVSVLQGARLADAGRRNPPRYLLSSTTLMLLRGKALNFALYTIYDNDADLAWIQASTVRWIEDLRRLNYR
jgi:hypothetical protein